MAILFSDIYGKAIALFDDPKITIAYETNKIQFHKLMYTYLQNAIAMFTNPASVGIRLVDYNVPVGTMETFESDGDTTSFVLSDDFPIMENSLYNYIEGNQLACGTFDPETKTVTFPDVIPDGQQYAFEQYYVGEFTNEFVKMQNLTQAGNTLIVEEIKDILARLLVKAWAESERNMLLDIRNLMQDSDFKITGNDRILKSKNLWVDQLDTEIMQLQNKLAWNIRFMNSSVNVGIGRG